MSREAPRALVVPEALDGVRIDRAITAMMPESSRAEIARWIEAGRVEVEGSAQTRASMKVRAGARVVVRPMAPPPSDALPDPSVIVDVLYEDDAIAVGAIDARATFDTSHGRHPTDRKAFTGRPRGGGKRAVTHVVVVERFASASVSRLECRLETGRTHQIRVHLAEHGAPLLADALYGKPPRDLRVRAIGARLGRQALHARVLGFAHPVTGKAMRFEAPWPADFAAAVEALRAL